MVQDPAAGALATRLAEIAAQAGRDPAFSAGSAFSRTGLGQAIQAATGSFAGAGNVEVRPIPGLPGAVGVFIDGEFTGTILGAEDFLDAGGSGFAPPAFSGTQAGLAFQGEQDRLLAAQGDVAAMERLRVSEAEAFRRAILGDVSAGVRGQISEEGAFRRGLVSETGAGARAQLAQLAALLQSREGLAGAGAQAGLSAFTTQRGQSIGAVQDIFGRLGDLAASPSDFLRLGFNAQGIAPPGSTPTDAARSAMQDFFASQTAFANRAPPTFADLFKTNRAAIGGATTLPDFGDLFAQIRNQIGGFGPAPNFAQTFIDARRAIGGFEFGGRPEPIEMKRGEDGVFSAAITGEHGQPELVTGQNIEVIPNLSRGELSLLRRGGIAGRQFGGGITSSQPAPLTVSPEDSRRRTDPATGFGSNVFDIPSLRPGFRPALFSGGFRRAAAGGVGAVTGLEPIDPLDFSLQSFLRMLPFQQQMLLAQFGESIVDPDDPNQVMRAGIDPQTAVEIIRRSSLVGSGGRGLVRFG